MDTVIGTCPHGKVLFAAVNEPDIMKQCRKDIADMIEAGFTITHTEGLAKFDGDCEACRPANRRRSK